MDFVRAHSIIYAGKTDINNLTLSFLYEFYESFLINQLKLPLKNSVNVKRMFYKVFFSVIKTHIIRFVNISLFILNLHICLRMCRHWYDLLLRFIFLLFKLRMTRDAEFLLFPKINIFLFIKKSQVLCKFV